MSNNIEGKVVVITRTTPISPVRSIPNSQTAWSRRISPRTSAKFYEFVVPPHRSRGSRIRHDPTGRRGRNEILYRPTRQEF